MKTFLILKIILHMYLDQYAIVNTFVSTFALIYISLAREYSRGFKNALF